MFDCSRVVQGNDPFEHVFFLSFFLSFLSFFFFPSSSFSLIRTTAGGPEQVVEKLKGDAAGQMRVDRLGSVNQVHAAGLENIHQLQHKKRDDEEEGEVKEKKDEIER